MAVVVGLEGAPTTVHDEFAVAELDRPDVESLASRLETVLTEAGNGRRNVVLAALAEVSARYLAAPTATDPDDFEPSTS